MNNLKKKKKGFTLIELIIVLAVMAIIALIAIPNLTAVKENSKKKADAQSVEVIKRTTQMLIASDGTGANKIVDGTYYWTGTELTDGSAAVDTTTTKTGDLKEALKDAKAPQQKGMYSYKIKITGDVVEVNVDATGAPSKKEQGNQTPQ